MKPSDRAFLVPNLMLPEHSCKLPVADARPMPLPVSVGAPALQPPWRGLTSAARSPRAPTCIPIGYRGGTCSCEGWGAAVQYLRLYGLRRCRLLIPNSAPAWTPIDASCSAFHRMTKVGASGEPKTPDCYLDLMLIAAALAAIPPTVSLALLAALVLVFASAT